jgi:hypothetical protein
MQRKHLIFANLFILVCALTYLACTKDPIVKADVQSEIQQSVTPTEASDRDAGVCSTGNCNYTVKVLSAVSNTVSNPNYAFDITRYGSCVPSAYQCENSFNRLGLPVGSSASFPIVNDSHIGLICILTDENGVNVSGTLTLRLTAPNGVSQNITLTGNALTEVFRRVKCNGIFFPIACTSNPPTTGG